MSVIKPEIDELLSKVDSRYTLCIISSRRARQINDLNHMLQDQALLAMTTSEVVEMRSGKKPLSLALEEIERGIVGYERTADGYK